MRRHRPTQHRRALAVVTALLWLLAVEVFPNLHLATHHHDHTHAADGSIVRLEDNEHAHEHGHGHPHEHEHARDVDDDDLARLGVAHEHIAIDLDGLGLDHVIDGATDAAHIDHVEHEVATADEATGTDDTQLRHRGQLAIDDAAPRGHAALGIAHHAIALHQPPPPLLAPVAAPSAVAWTHAAPNERLSSAAPHRPTARGPPLA